jgi:hypothetical protein
MARKQHASAGVGLLDEYLTNGVDSGGVESGQRFVEHQQLRVVHEGRSQLDALLIPVRESLDLAVGAVGYIQALEPLPGGDRSALGVHAVQPSEILKLVCDEHVRVEAPFFRHVTETPSLGGTDRYAVPPNRAGVEVGQPEDGSHCGGLTCSVWTEEAHNLARRN